MGKLLLILLFSFFYYFVYSLPQECGMLVPPSIPSIDDFDYELQQVSIVFRHGDRLMYQDAECWPNDTAVFECQAHHLSTPSFLSTTNSTNSGRLFRKQYMQGRNYYNGNCETGQLTNKGFEQEYATGKMYKIHMLKVVFFQQHLILILYFYEVMKQIDVFNHYKVC